MTAEASDFPSSIKGKKKDTVEKLKRVGPFSSFSFSPSSEQLEMKRRGATTAALGLQVGRGSGRETER